jgi:hypothetical protein
MTFGTVQHTLRSGYGRLREPGATRITFVTLVVVLAAIVEYWTTVPGFRLLLTLVVIVAPAVLFDRFWRLLMVLREGNIDELLARRRRHDWRGWRLLWLAFVAVWALDLVATVWFFFTPTARELHPVTVFLYGVAGIPGVLFAGTSYAVLAVLIVRRLPKPHDFDFLVATTLWYGLLVVHNYVLLLGG